MARFEKRKKVQSALYNPITVGVIVVATILLGLSAFSVFQKRQEAYQNAMTAEHQLEVLNAQKATVQNELNTLNTPQGVEAAIRNEYQAAKDGEGLVVIVGNKDAPKDDTAFDTTPPPPQSWWQKVLTFLHL